MTEYYKHRRNKYSIIEKFQNKKTQYYNIKKKICCHSIFYAHPLHSQQNLIDNIGDFTT